MDILSYLLAAPASRPGPVPSFTAPVDRALAGGFHGDRLAAAFVAGYHAALAHLVATTGASTQGRAFPARLSFAVTEKGGGHPRAVLTTLTRDGDGFVLRGTKTFATLAREADELLVVATRGANAAGQNELAVVRVPRAASGVLVNDRPDLPFAPELSHAVVQLSDVRVAADDVLPGDGYAAYVRPFRTVEDVHVVAATVGHLVGAARTHGFDTALLTELTALAVVLRALASQDASAPTTHVALAGALATFRRLLGPIAQGFAQSAPHDEHARWERDLPLLLVADAVRETRTLAAFAALARVS